MNTETISGVALEKALAEKLRELLASMPELTGWKVERNPAAFDRAFDIEARVPLPGGITVEFWVECNSDPRPSRFPYVNVSKYFGPSGIKLVRVAVFAAPYISPNMGEVCREHNWSWFDLAGNCHFSVPGVPFRLERSGQEPVHAVPRPTANLSTPESARVVRALLAPANAGRRWIQREMAEHFGQQNPPLSQPSLALVNKVVQHLRNESYIEAHPDGGFRLRKPVELLTAWRDAYRFDRHQLKPYFTLLQGDRLHEALRSLKSSTGGQVALAAFSAAEFQAPHVRQPREWFFVGAEHEERFQSVLNAKLVDSLGYNLSVLIPDDDGVFYLAEDKVDQLPCTNPVQTYVDLYNCKGRGEEAAEAMLEQNLKPAWQAKGLL